MWLAEQGRLGQVAQRLGIHPQTARYRLGRLRELFGDALDDPDSRFWLELALRVQQGLERAPGDQGRGVAALTRASPWGLRLCRGLGRRHGGRLGLGLGDLGPERAGGDLLVPPVDDRDLVVAHVAARGTRSSPGRPSSGTSPPCVANQDIWVIL